MQRKAIQPMLYFIFFNLRRYQQVHPVGTVNDFYGNQSHGWDVLQISTSWLCYRMPLKEIVNTIKQALYKGSELLCCCALKVCYTVNRDIFHNDSEMFAHRDFNAKVILRKMSMWDMKQGHTPHFSFI